MKLTGGPSLRLEGAAERGENVRVSIREGAADRVRHAVRDGKAVREGAGLSMAYFAPTSSLVVVPTAASTSLHLRGGDRGLSAVTVQGQ